MIIHELDAEKYFEQAVPSNDSLSRKNLHALFNENEKLKHKNPKAAKVLSMIIPGAGQLYAGDVKNGLNSLLLTGGFFLLFINTSIAYTFVDALVAVGPWYYRYYLGGYQRAETITINRVEMKRARIYRKMLDTVQSATL